MTAPQHPAAPPRRIPFWATVRAAYALPLRAPAVTARLLGPWFAIVVALTAARLALTYSGGVPTGEDESDLSDALSTAVEVASIVEFGVAALAGVVAAVKWHRYVLLDETGGVLSLPQKITLASYIYAALVIFVLGVVPIYLLVFGGSWLIAYMVNEILGVPPAAAATGLLERLAQDAEMIDIVIASALLAVPVWAAVSYLPLRCTLALPEAALGKHEELLSRAWQLSRGSFWRLFWGSILTSAPLLALGSVTLLLGEPDLEAPGRFVANDVLYTSASFISALIWVGFLSLSYRALCPASDEAHAEPACTR